MQMWVHFVGESKCRKTNNSWWEGSDYWIGEIYMILWENIVMLSDMNAECTILDVHVFWDRNEMY